MEIGGDLRHRAILVGLFGLGTGTSLFGSFVASFDNEHLATKVERQASIGRSKAGDRVELLFNSTTKYPIKCLRSVQNPAFHILCRALGEHLRNSNVVAASPFLPSVRQRKPDIQDPTSLCPVENCILWHDVEEPLENVFCAIHAFTVLHPHLDDRDGFDAQNGFLQTVPIKPC